MGYDTVSRLFHWVTGAPRPGHDTGRPRDGTRAAAAVAGPALHPAQGPRAARARSSCCSGSRWRAFHPAPPLPADGAAGAAAGRAVVHAGLYAALLVMGVSGYVFVDAGDFPTRGAARRSASRRSSRRTSRCRRRRRRVHVTCAFVLIALIAMHVGAAAFHGLVQARRRGGADVAAACARAGRVPRAALRFGRFGDGGMLAGRRILLIIGGGIAAYKSLELIRLLRKAGAGGGAGPDRRRRRVRDAAHASRRWPASRSMTALFDLTAEAEMGHIELSPQRRPGGRGAGDRRPDRQAGARPRQRPRQHPAARHRQAGAARAGDERAHVGAPGDAAQPRDARAPTARSSSAPTRARWPRRVRPRPHGRAAGDRRRDRRRARRRARSPARARPRHLRPDPRADRPGALHRQPLVRPPGHAHRRGARRARRAGHLRHRPGRGAAAARRRGRRGRDRARDARRVSRRRCRPTSRSSPPRSPTGAWPPPAARKIKKDGRRAAADARRSPRTPTSCARVAGRGAGRPRLVVGFAAETDDVVANATAKRLRKGCDWIVANDVQPATGIMGGAENARDADHRRRRRALAADVEGRRRPSALADRIAAALA